MRPRLFSRCFLARPYGVHARYFGTQPLVSGKLSLAASPKTSKRKVIDELARHVDKSPIGLRSDGLDKGSYGATILASRDFTTWLHDEGFMSSILETLFKSMDDRQVGLSQLNLLSGVVDGIGPKDFLGEPQTGFSILYGSTEDMFPDLWDSKSFEPTGESKDASISFTTNPLEGDTRPIELTLPLTNTVFQNGRQSTLSASRWDLNSLQGPMTLKAMSHKSTQKIFAYGGCANYTSTTIPLVPITPPRKIVTGLGNIVRQVEVDGSTTPASKELEALIPQIFDIRSKRHATTSSGPIGVWCWVIPAHVVETKKLLDLKVLSVESSLSEAELALESAKTFSGLLSSGCRLHKILSGGGGWGRKQGLLSLDPETHYSLPGEDDIEMFIKSFEERNNANSSEGLVTPGSYLMFCIEPQWTGEDVVSSQTPAPRPTLSLGVAPHSDLAQDANAGTEKVEVVEGQFGATSATGLFLRTIPELSGINVKYEAARSSQSFTTKVDVPRACFWTGGV